MLRQHLRRANPQRPQVSNGSDVVTGTRLPNGEVVFVTANTEGPNLFRLDEKFEPVGTPLEVARFVNTPLAGIAVTPGGKLLVTHQNQVAEYDLKDGKAGWTFDVRSPTSVQRLPNGNTLITSMNDNRAVEVTPDREVVWDFQYRGPDGQGMNMARIYRR